IDRRMHRTTVLTVIVAVAPLGLIAVLATSDSWWTGTFIALGLLATFPLLTRWNIDDHFGTALYYLTASTAVWVMCAAFGINPLGFFSLALVGAMLIPRFP